MGDSESEREDDYPDYDSSACLDEWGWDPSVDSLLEEVVADAPHLPNGQTDWSWVSYTFLEFLAPEEEQLEAALEKFSPAALQERFLYLRSGRATPRSLGTGLEDEEEEEEEEPSGSMASASTTLAPVIDAFPASIFSTDNEEAVASDEPQCSGNSYASAATPEDGSGAGKKDRDRVLDAMQSFLFGRPRPQAKPVPTPASAAAPSKQAWVVSEDATSAAEAEEATALGVACGSEPCSNEALRCCLDELRWHGEALRLCAAGADATGLAGEAAGRRKALLYRLGFGPGEGSSASSRGMA